MELLARASELDAVRWGGSSVADLRASAAEAGISAEAFDAALAEFQRTPRAGGPASPRRSRWALGAGAVALLLAGMLVGSGTGRRGGGGVAPGVPTIEEAIVLRCLAPGDAAELVRPVLQDRSSRVLVNPAHAPRVITIRATPALLRQAKAVLAEHEGAGSGTCAVPPPARGVALM
ncbi:MAG TPA: hypothetical protein VGB24_10465 [Longimicrobium sp.]